jgi:lactoylglutathione lyase
MGLRYCGIRVQDLDRSVRFYTELMGLQEQHRGRSPHGGVWVLLRDPRTHQRLELNWYPQRSPHATRYVPGEGLDHLGFHVSDPKRMFHHLVTRGAEPALVPSDQNGVRGIYYLKDPDGNWVELY